MCSLNKEYCTIHCEASNLLKKATFYKALKSMESGSGDWTINIAALSGIKSFAKRDSLQNLKASREEILSLNKENRSFKSLLFVYSVPRIRTLIWCWLGSLWDSSLTFTDQNRTDLSWMIDNSIITEKSSMCNRHVHFLAFDNVRSSKIQSFYYHICLVSMQILNTCIQRFKSNSS